MSRRKTLPALASLGALPMFGIGTGVLYLLYQALRVRGGKEWRGYAGTVTLKPSVVYRFDLVAPSSPAIDAPALEAKLASGGARNFLWNALPTETHLYFDQSFQNPVTVTFGKSGLPPLTTLTARRVDGLDWDAP